MPLAIYRDQHSTLQRNDKHWSLKEELARGRLPTQAGRALDELGIEAIVARSPQAKGRVERTWKAKDTLMRAYCTEVAIDRVS